MTFDTYDKTALNICIVSQGMPWTRPSGIASYSWTLAKGLRSMGQSVHVITKGSADYTELHDGVCIHTVLPEQEDFDLGSGLPVTSRNLRWSVAAARRIRALHEHHTVDIVESPLWDFEGIAYTAAKLSKTVVRLQTPLLRVIESNKWQVSEDLEYCVRLEKEFLSRADGVIGISKYILDEIRWSYEIDTVLPEAVIYVGIQPAQQNAAPHSGDQIYKTVLFAGRLEFRKGIENILLAIPKVINRVDNARFVIAGRDTRPFGGVSTAEFFRNRVPKGMSDCVKFCGEVSDAKLEACYCACDVFVAPSLYESFGIVFLEAMRHRKPVVATNVGGIPEVVEDGVTGILVSKDDPDELAAAVVLLLRDDGLRFAMGEAGWRTACERFTVDRMCSETLQFYRQVINGCGRTWLPSLLPALPGPRGL